jgi:hypothetical protein
MPSDDLEWLHITVAFRPGRTTDFILEITFANRSARGQSAQWSFRNILGRAERLGLQLRLPGGAFLEPVDFIFGTPAGQHEHAGFPFGAQQQHILVGKVEQRRLLRFAGASYLIQPGYTYEVAFQYGGVRSNTLTWQAPPGT